MDQGFDWRRRVVFPLMVTGLCLALLVLAYLVTAAVRGIRLKNDLAFGPRSSADKVLRVDPVIGFVPAPGLSGLDPVPLGDPVVVQHDARGFRIAAGANGRSAGRRPRILFLGDSFTYGRMVAAEDTFAALTAARLGGEALNAGVNGYGLAQMVLRARQLIPEYRPDIVVVQYSPWLVDRSMEEFAPAEAGKESRSLFIPSAYYTSGAPLQIAAPQFDASLETALMPEARAAAPHLARWPFFWRYALPVIWHQDSRLAWFHLRQALGLAPRPLKNKVEIVRGAYAELAALASRHQARMLILALGDDAPLQVPGELFPPGVGGVNGWRMLVARLPSPEAIDYQKQYMIWRGTPPQFVDWHPNERAHELLAEALVTRIRMDQAAAGTSASRRR